MITDELDVWLHGDVVARIHSERRGPRLAYSPVALARYPMGTPLLSHSLPVSMRSYPQGVVRAFLDGLLPEGLARGAIARDLGVSPTDTLALIRALGRDCAGAVVIQSANDPPPPIASVTAAELLTENQLGELVRNLRSAPLGVGGRVRISLAGVQEKLVLTRMLNGAWGEPG